MRTSTLEELIRGMAVLEVAGGTQVAIEGVAYDSRDVRPGWLFVCIKGERRDGHDFASDAVDRGAVALVVEDGRAVAVPGGVTVVTVPSSRVALAHVARAFYGDPSGSMLCVGVTGTKGKTTTTLLIKNVLDASGRACGVMGTIWYVIGDETIPAKRTTPESLDVQMMLSEMRARGQDSCAMEVSSHAVALDRVLGVDFDIGVFTNIGHDHLDFHRTFEDYLETKAAFFESLGREPSRKDRPKTAIINLDDPHAGRIVSASRVNVLTYGISSQADVRPRDLELGRAGASFVAITPCGEFAVRTRLAGVFNVSNALAAIACGVAAGADGRAIAEGVARLQGVPGRFETIDEGQPFAVIVDYAHTPDSLENILRAASGLGVGRVIAVFGCGGDRDRTKRPLMGEAAARLADYVIITSDNPRSEDPDAICREIEQGVLRVRTPGDGYEVVVDRFEAISRAISRADEGDVVVIAGKGHETYQIFRDRTIHFDDREVARDLLKERMGRA